MVYPHVICNKMKTLKFDIKSNDNLNEYHLGATYDKWLEKTIWNDKKVLYNKLLESYDNQQSDWHKLFYNLAYYNCSHEENIFIYEKLIWELINDKKIYAIINFRTASFLSSNDLPFDKIDWEYEIEYQSNIENTETIFSDNGFVKARTGWIKPATPRWNNSEEDKTALFEIDNFETFIKVVFEIIMDECGSINLFCSEENRKSDLVTILNSKDRPNIQQILNPKDIFITMFLGEDEGYQDYILLKSFSDLSLKLTRLTNDLNEGGKIYENGLEGVKDFESLLELIYKSFGLKINTDNTVYSK